MNFEDVEELDGLRFSWNAFPSTRIEAGRTVVPIGALYTPLKEREDLPTAQYDPITCRTPCRAVLNPFCQLDIRARLWVCPFCMNRNPLPPAYEGIGANNLPIELDVKSSTIEYILTRPVQTPPVFLYIVDICQDDENLAALKESLIVSLSLLPPNALIGLITYGTMVHVHDLGYEICPKSYVFRGDKEYSPVLINELLSSGPSAAAKPAYGRPTISSTRFFLPVDQVDFQLTNLLENLEKDPWPVANDRRALRATGAAISIGVSMLETAFSGCGARVMLFAGGPGTTGPGLIVGPQLKEPIRSHNDIDKDNAKHYKKSVNFFEGIAARLTTAGHSFDIFTGCYDQIGIQEMKSLPNQSGGVMILADAFTTAIFKQSFLRMFNKDDDGFLLMGFNGSLEILTSKELKISGLIGPAVSAKKSSSSVGDSEVGIGNTCSWKLCATSPNLTYATFFDVANTSSSAIVQAQSQGMIQYLTHYQHASGTYRLRVTTVGRKLCSGGDPSISGSFDQEAAAVLMSRIAVFKAEVDDGPDIIRWTDRMLIRLCQKFADYHKDDPASFRLAPNFSLYPQFMFHLRRSQFLQVFNNSPDETAFYRHVLTREDVTNSLIMIQPTLTAFGIGQEPEPVLLDSVSIKPDRILLLDTFFHILIYHGETIAAWRKEGYQDDPEYEDFKSTLEEPRQEAAELLVDRFPLPRFIDTEAGGSQARFLLSRLNPSNSYQNTGDAYGGAVVDSAIVLTDDVSLQTFMQHLTKLAVAGSS